MEIYDYNVELCELLNLSKYSYLTWMLEKRPLSKRGAESGDFSAASRIIVMGANGWYHLDAFPRKSKMM
jgi:hypothetical protein